MWVVFLSGYSILRIQLITDLDNNRRLFVCSYNKHPSSSGFKCGWIPILVWCHQELVSVHPWLCSPLCWMSSLAGSPPVVARWLPAALGVRAASLAIIAERNDLSPKHLSKRSRAVSVCSGISQGSTSVLVTVAEGCSVLIGWIWVPTKARGLCLFHPNHKSRVGDMWFPWRRRWTLYRKSALGRRTTDGLYNIQGLERFH